MDEYNVVADRVAVFGDVGQRDRQLFPVAGNGAPAGQGLRSYRCGAGRRQDHRFETAIDMLSLSGQ